MARCSCGNATCSCVIKPEPDSGVTVSGNGSPTRPYLIGLESDGDIRNQIAVTDTATLNLEMGAPDSSGKSTIYGYATQKMTDLADVADLEGPQEGDVPIWTNGHWEFKPQGTVNPGAISVSNGIGGDGSAPNPLKALTSGVFGTAPLSTPPFHAAVQDFGNEIYLDTTGRMRARPQVLWRALDANALPSAYPNGMSVMSVGPENVTGWPGAAYGAVHTLKRLETTSGQAIGQVQQWFYTNASAQVMYRYAANDSPGWSGWLTSYMAMSEIPNAANLNTYTRPGQYAQQQNAEAAAGTNYPAPYAGMLEVGSTDSGNMLWQRYTTYSEAGGSVQGNAVYQRAYYSTGAGWGPWICIGGDSGWIDIPIQAGFTAQASEKPQVRKFNGVCYSRGGWSATGLTVSGTNDPVGMMPVGYRPTQNVLWRAGSSAGNVTTQMFIASTGNISVRNGPVVNYAMMGVSWLTD